MFDTATRLAERLAANISESRRGFLGRVGSAALGVGGLLGFPAAARANGDGDKNRHCCAKYACVHSTTTTFVRCRGDDREDCPSFVHSACCPTKKGKPRGGRARRLAKPTFVTTCSACAGATKTC